MDSGFEGVLYYNLPLSIVIAKKKIAHRIFIPCPFLF